jgi:CRP/FNR family transcriptional regulator
MIEIMSRPTHFAAIEAACPPGAVLTTALASGETLFKQGDPSPGLSIVLEGQVALMRWTASGRAIKIHAAAPGETFAEASLFVPSCHCDALATEPSRIATIRKQNVLQALAGDPALAMGLMQHLASSLMQARRLLELRATAPLTEALLARIAELADADGRLPEGLALQSLAADAGVTPPALYRALASLERNGSIERPARGRVRLKTAR